MWPVRYGSSLSASDGKTAGLPSGAAVAFCLLALLFLVRVWYLDADPPLGLSGSSSVYTDPSQYTLFAKMYVQSGDANPYHEDRFVLFIKSAVTLLAVVVFKLFGVGLGQSHLTGLLYSFGGVLLFFLFLRKVAGLRTGLFFLALILFDYNQLFYGRLPFLEHAMFFYAALAIFLLTYFRGGWGHLLAGISLAVSVFFGKIIGLPFLFPFACFLAYRYAHEDTGSRRGRAAKPVLFAAGFAFMTLVWMVFSYLPLPSRVTGYVSEQAVGLYGPPDGLQSMGDFIWSMVSFGIDSNLFPRMSVVAVLGAIMLCMILYHVSRRRSWKEGFGSFNAGHIFVAATIVAFYGSLMIWNYRPLRYQLVLIYPFCAAAAMILTMLWRQWRTPDNNRTPWLFYPLSFPLFLIVVSQGYSALMDQLGFEFAFEDRKYLVILLAAVATAGAGVAIKLYRSSRLPRASLVGKVVVIAVIAWVIGSGFVDYGDWWRKPTFTARDNARDLEMILSPEAVLSGPYAAEFAVAGKLGAVIHMFGVVHVDRELFERFPVTHLLLDKGNETRARNDYPRLMGTAVHLCTYHVRLKKVRLFRIAGRTGNQQADSYQRSAFELALDYYRADSVARADRYAMEWVRDHPHSISGPLMLAERAQKAGHFEEAEVLFKKAVEFSPTNYNLNSRLAMFYKDRFDATGDVRYKSGGIDYFECALRYAPHVEKMKRAYAELKGTDFDG